MKQRRRRSIAFRALGTPILFSPTINPKEKSKILKMAFNYFEF